MYDRDSDCLRLHMERGGEGRTGEGTGREGRAQDGRLTVREGQGWIRGRR
jgi:hypothetical protein